MTDQDQNNHPASLETVSEDDAIQVAAPAPFEAVSVDLPADPESIEFAHALQALKPLFGSRTEYNFMVCDQLALRGMAPNGLNVRKAGSWGNPVAVGADVKTWYTALSARLSSEHAKIPEAAKRSANSLFEQLWTLATASVGQPILDQLKQAQDLIREQSEASSQEIENLRRELDIARGDHDAAKQQLEQARKEIFGLETAHQDLSSEVNTLGRSIAQAALDHEHEKREIERAHAVVLDRLRTVASEAAASHAKELSAVQAQIQAERDRSDQAAKAHALAIDGFRQDLRRAVDRGDKALEDLAQERMTVNSLREQVSNAVVEKAGLERRLSEASSRLSDVTESLQLLHHDAAAALPHLVSLLNEDGGSVDAGAATSAAESLKSRLASNQLPH